MFNKKDSKEPIANYRPISILPVVGTILGRCVDFRFYEHIVCVVNPSQHFFLQNLSCVSQLLSVQHTTGKDLDKNMQTNILYLDFVKAFHSTDSAILLRTLRSYGVTGSFLNWFANTRKCMEELKESLWVACH